MVDSKVLFVSGSLGLGHATRDLAVARELRRRAPGTEIGWLAASPTAEMLSSAGETLVPESREYRCETDTADAMGASGPVAGSRFLDTCPRPEYPGFMRGRVDSAPETGICAWLLGEEVFP